MEEGQGVGGDGEDAHDHQDGAHPGHRHHVPAVQTEDDAQDEPAEEGPPEGIGAVTGHAQGRTAHGGAPVPAHEVEVAQETGHHEPLHGIHVGKGLAQHGKAVRLTNPAQDGHQDDEVGDG